jgi:hypothetical protein
MKPHREIIGAELCRQVSPRSKPDENWYLSADDVIRALEAAGYVITAMKMTNGEPTDDRPVPGRRPS